MAKILITGCRGQLGTDCRTVLAHHEIQAVDLPELDITDAVAVRARLSAFRPDAIVNCAAYTAVDRAESDEALCAHVNTDGPATLAAACAEAGCRLVHVSTDYVLPGTRPVPESAPETDPTGPSSVYGRTKLAGERAIAEAGCDHVILRTAWLYGAHGKNFPKTMLRLALKNPAHTARVVADQWGCPTWSYRLAEQIRAVLEAPRGAVQGVCHAVGLGHTNWFEFAETFLTLMDVPHALEPCTTADYPTPAKRPANSILEDRRLREAGLLAMDDWKDALAAFVRLHREDLLAEAKTLL